MAAAAAAMPWCSDQCSASPQGLHEALSPIPTVGGLWAERKVPMGTDGHRFVFHFFILVKQRRAQQVLELLQF